MAVATIRSKNQVTLPARLLSRAGLKQGDPVEFEALPSGGLAVRPYGYAAKRQSALDLARELLAVAPAAADIDWEPARLGGGPRAAGL
jgi:AbrB family looped-hinge helix DNA binding protein